MRCARWRLPLDPSSHANFGLGVRQPETELHTSGLEICMQQFNRLAPLTTERLTHKAYHC